MLSGRVTTLIVLWCFLHGHCAIAASCGDPDGDGDIDVVDALLCAQVAVGMSPLPYADLWACDVDRSLAIGVLDSLKLAQASAGLPVVLSCPTASVGCQIQSPLPMALVTGEIPIVFTVYEFLGNPVEVTIVVKRFGGPPILALAAPATSAPMDMNPSAPFTTTAPITFIWDSVPNLFPRYIGPVTIDITVASATDVSLCQLVVQVDNLAPPPSRPSTNGLIVTELHAQPLGVAETAGEWFEIQNISGITLDLSGSQISDGGVDFHVLSPGAALVMQHGERLVFGINANPFTNGNVAVDHEYSNFTLDNSADELIFTSPYGVQITRLAYDSSAGWPITPGASLILEPSINEPGNASLPASWCTSALPWASGDLGSPGMANESCGLGLVPACSFFTPSSGFILTGDAILTLFGWPDDDSHLLDLEYRYSTDAGATWNRCTSSPRALVGYEIVVLQNPAPGAAYRVFPTCYWDSAADLPGVTGLQVDVEIQVTDSAHVTSCGVSGLFVTNP